MYSNLSNFSEDINTSFIIIFSVISFFLVAITITLLVFVFRYREKKNPEPTPIKGNVWLEIIWTVIPLGLVIGMFYYGWMAWIPMFSDAPEESIEIKTTARMWSWLFEYENGKKTDTLYVPEGRPVELQMTSPDVLHSLYIPAYRIKRDVVPGRITNIWFEPRKTGSYDLFCAEYCGLQHSYMITEVKVLSQEEFDKWYIDTTAVAQASSKPGAEGLQILRLNGCVACHSLDGSKLVGPSYKGIWGHEVEVETNGQKRTITVDADYVKNSVYNPDDDIVVGFTKGLMRSYKGELSDNDIEQIIVYLQTLSDKHEEESEE